MRRSMVALACALAAALAVPAPAQSGAVGIQLAGGAYNTQTALKLHGTPGRKYLLVMSVVSAPGLNFIPNQSADVGIEFLGLSLVLPGFTGVFNGSGTATALLVVPHIPELDTYPLYFQLFMTGPTGNKLVDKSVVQTLTMQASQTWKAPQPGSDYVSERSTHTMTLLPGGKVLTLGGGAGITASYGLSSAELYDTSNETLTLLPHSMVQARTGHTATLLNDGRVLVVGGADDVAGEPTATAETYDPATGSFTAVGSMVGGPRALHVAAKLDDGRVLISGGTNSYVGPSQILLGSLRTTEIFNPATNSFSAGPQLSKARLGQTVTRLPNGKWLVAGGYTRITIPFIGEVPIVSDDFELYTPSAGAGSFGGVGPLNHQRTGHGAVLLLDGRVLLAGGANGSNPFAPMPEMSWEIYDPVFGSIVDEGALTDGRILPAVVPLGDGRVLIAGGAVGTLLDPISVATAEIWSSTSGVSAATGNLMHSRAGHASLLLPDGTVLVSGGGTTDPGFVDGLTSLEIYQP